MDNLYDGEPILDNNLSQGDIWLVNHMEAVNPRGLTSKGSRSVVQWSWDLTAVFQILRFREDEYDTKMSGLLEITTYKWLHAEEPYSCSSEHDNL